MQVIFLILCIYVDHGFGDKYDHGYGNGYDKDYAHEAGYGHGYGHGARHGYGGAYGSSAFDSGHGNDQHASYGISNDRGDYSSFGLHQGPVKGHGGYGPASHGHGFSVPSSKYGHGGVSTGAFGSHGGHGGGGGGGFGGGGGRGGHGGGYGGYGR